MFFQLCFGEMKVLKSIVARKLQSAEHIYINDKSVLIQEVMHCLKEKKKQKKKKKKEKRKREMLNNQKKLSQKLSQNDVSNNYWIKCIAK